MTGKTPTHSELLEKGLIDENGYPAGKLKEAIQSHPLIVEYKKQLEKERKEQEEKARRIEENKTVVAMYQLAINSYLQMAKEYEDAYYELTDGGKEPEKGEHLTNSIFRFLLRASILKRELEKLEMV
jgi:hypothetical protein